MLQAERASSTSSGRELTDLYREHSAEVFRFALHLTGRRADAEDVVQQVFLQAHRQLESGRTLVSPRSWLLTATRHRALNLARRREIPVESELLESARAPDGVDEAELLADVRSMLWTLPEHQHQAFVLRHWSGLSQREIADVLQTSPAAVESLLARARSALLGEQRTASDACRRVRGRMVDALALNREDSRHVESCRRCRHAQGRLSRVANAASGLALVPRPHVAEAIARAVPGFSAHAATAGGLAAGSGGAGAGAWGSTAAAATAKTAMVVKTVVAVIAVTAAAAAVPQVRHTVTGTLAGHAPPSTVRATRPSSPQARQGTGSGSPPGDPGSQRLPGPPGAHAPGHGLAGAGAGGRGKGAGGGQGAGAAGLHGSHGKPNGAGTARAVGKPGSAGKAGHTGNTGKSGGKPANGKGAPGGNKPGKGGKPGNNPGTGGSKPGNKPGKGGGSGNGGGSGSGGGSGNGGGNSGGNSPPGQTPKPPA